MSIRYEKRADGVYKITEERSIDLDTGNSVVTYRVEEKADTTVEQAVIDGRKAEINAVDTSLKNATKVVADINL